MTDVVRLGLAGLVALVLLGIAVEACPAAADAPTRGEARELPEAFLNLFRPGQVVSLNPVETRYDVLIGPGVRGANLECTVIAVKADYVALDDGESEIYLPAASIRQVLRVRFPEAEMRKSLDRPISLKVDRVPLDDTVALISQRMKLEIQVDRDGLRSQGYTRNMPQTLAHEAVAAREILESLIEKHPGLVLAMDDAGLVLTSDEAARERGLTVLVPLPEQP